MTTTTQHGQITLPASELRQILAVLDEFTTSDKNRHVLTLAQVRPIIVEMSAKDQKAGTLSTALEWQATDSYALVSITHRVAHTLTGPALIDPTQLLAALPKKADTNRAGESVLTIGAGTWQITTGQHTTERAQVVPEAQWPNTWGLWKDQKPELAPHSMASWQHDRLGKIGKHLAGKDGTRIDIATMHNKDGQPNPHGPIVYTIEATEMEVRALFMPQRKQ